MTVTKAIAAPLTITLFGPLSVYVHGEPIPHLRSRKAQWLLALLVLRQGRPVAREWLAGTLWSEVDQEQAFANLRPILSELRKALGSESERLQSPNRHSLLLEMTGAEVDVAVFDAAMASKSLAALERAVVLYRGSLLEGCSEEWVAQERAGREQACLTALKTLAEAALAAGNYEEAANYYRQATILDPLWDAACRGLMDALSRGGDRNAALQVYREFVNALQSNDSKAVPGDATTALYQRLRTEARRQASAPTHHLEMTPPPVVGGYLPNSLTELVGREDERLEVGDRLRRSRLVTLTGPGGIGKTRLAVAVAHEVVREYADGVWLVALESLPPGTGSDEEQQRPVLQQIASVLGIKEGSGRPLRTVITEHLRRKRSLLVLDNCEHLLEPCAGVIASLMHGCPGLRFLATSRETLRVSGETTWSVPALTVPDVEELPSGRMTLVRMLAGYDAVQLFVERAGAVQKTFALTGDNARDVARLCSRLAGIPLALELAAARTAVLTPAEILAQFDARPLDALASRLRDTVPRHRTLRATLEWSYDLLPPEARTFLLAMGVFRGGWTLEAVQAVYPDDAAVDRLMVLQDASLIHVTETEDGSRFSMLETVRQFAAEKLHATDEAAHLRNRHRDWCIALAEKAVKQIKGPGQPIAMRRLETDQDNLRAALAWCEEDDQGAEAGLRLAGALWRFWSIRSDFSEGRKYLERALERDGAQARTAERANALRGASSLTIRQGDFVRSQELDEEYLSIQRELGNLEGIATALCNLGNRAFSRGDYAEAQRLYAESLNRFRELGHPRPIAWSLSGLGMVTQAQGDDAAAQAFFEESLRLCREFGDQQGIAYALISLGSAVDSLGDHSKAHALYEESLTLYQELGNKHGIARVFMGLGSVAFSLGDYDEASFQMARGLTIHQELGDSEAIALNLGGLAEVMLGKKDVVTAVRLWAAAQYLRDSIGLSLPPLKEKDYAQKLEQARRLLGEDAFAAVWKAGYAPAEGMIGLMKQQGV